MAFVYGEIWEAIKTNGSAELVVSKAHSRTVIQGVRRTKSFENGLKRKAKKLRFAKLWTKVEELSSERVKVTFTLSYETRL